MVEFEALIICLNANLINYYSRSPYMYLSHFQSHDNVMCHSTYTCLCHIVMKIGKATWVSRQKMGLTANVPFAHNNSWDPNILKTKRLVPHSHYRMCSTPL